MRLNTRYLNRFIKLKASPDILQFSLFPNVKEITESFGALDAVFNHLPEFDRADPKIRVFCVGDGKTPRTAALFTFCTRWTCYSIDPRLKYKPKYERIKRLHCIDQKVEDVVPYVVDKGIVVAVHSHANMFDSVSVCDALCHRAAVAIPCCFPQKLRTPPDVGYHDEGILSSCNLVQVWKDV